MADSCFLRATVRIALHAAHFFLFPVAIAGQCNSLSRLINSSYVCRA